MSDTPPELIADCVAATQALQRLAEECVRLSRSIDTKVSTYNQGLADALLDAADLAEAMIRQIEIDGSTEGAKAMIPEGRTDG